MPFSTWIRDAFGIRKDVIDTKKSKLEIKKLEEEDSDRNLITRASMDDVSKYDATLREIDRKAQSEESELHSIPLWLILVAGLLAAIFDFSSGHNEVSQLCQYPNKHMRGEDREANFLCVHECRSRPR